MNQHTLDRYADLPGIDETPGCDPGCGKIKIRVFMHDHCRIPSQFQPYSFLACDFPQVPPNCTTASEGKICDPGIAYQLLRTDIWARYHTDRFRRETCLKCQFTENQTAHGCCGCGFENDGIARSDCRREFMACEIQREIKRDNPHNRPEWKTLEKPGSPFSIISPVQRDNLSIDPFCLLRRSPDGCLSTGDLSCRKLFCFTTLHHQNIDQLISPVPDFIRQTEKYA